MVCTRAFGVLVVIPMVFAPFSVAQMTEPLQSGPQVGERLPAPFNVLCVVDAESPQAAGTKTSFVEQYGANPVVLIFARQVNHPLRSLIKKLDGEVAKRKAAKLRALVILLEDDFDVTEASLKKLTDEDGIKNVSLAVDVAKGPPGYRLDQEADLTAILYRKYRIVANHAFRKAEWSEKSIHQVFADVSKLTDMDKITSDTHLDPKRIAAIVGVKATTTKDRVVRIAWARTDVAVTVDGMPLKPFAGLGSWAAFTPAPHGAMVMGDTVVFEDEVTPAMDAAFAGGLEVTGLHNHFFHDEPKVYFMHIGGQGDPEKLAAAVKGVWDAIKKVRTDRPKPATRFAGEAPREGKIDAAAIEGILGQKSETQQGVVKVTIGSDGAMHGVKVGGSMGLTTWAAFSGSDELAAVDGDFIMTAGEVQPVLKALRKANIHVVALHNHMIGEQPAFYFTHFWSKGPAQELAKGVKSALDAQRQAAQAKGH